MGKLIDEKVDVKFDDVHMLVVKSLSRLKTLHEIYHHVLRKSIQWLFNMALI